MWKSEEIRVRSYKNLCYLEKFEFLHSEVNGKALFTLFVLQEELAGDIYGRLN